jgi:hypothetical protein
MFAIAITIRDTHLLAVGPFSNEDQAVTWETKFHKIMGPLRHNCHIVPLSQSSTEIPSPEEFFNSID